MSYFAATANDSMGNVVSKPSTSQNHAPKHSRVTPQEDLMSPSQFKPEISPKSSKANLNFNPNMPRQAFSPLMSMVGSNNLLN